ELDQWVKMEEEAENMLNIIDKEQTYPAEQLKMLADYTDDFQIEPSDDTLVATFQVKDKTYHELLDTETIQQTFPPELMEMIDDERDIMKDIHMNHIAYEMTFDQENYELESFHIDMNVESNDFT